MIVIEMMKREKSPYFFSLGIPKYTFIYPIVKQKRMLHKRTCRENLVTLYSY
jgi:hypothetical protein